jgi:hypothetical protein
MGEKDRVEIESIFEMLRLSIYDYTIPPEVELQPNKQNQEIILNVQLINDDDDEEMEIGDVTEFEKKKKTLFNSATTNEAKADIIMALTLQDLNKITEAQG